MYYDLDTSPLFAYDGRHCEEMGVAFIPSQYPFVPAQTVPTVTIPGRHGTLRYKGRTYKPRYLKGTLYLLDTIGDTGPIATAEMLQRMSDVAAWLCGRDGRGRLVLDAQQDRYYIAEVEQEALLKDDDWAIGSAQISFCCQPFAFAVHEDNLTVTTAANTAKTVSLSVRGNAPTLLAFDVTNTSNAILDTLQVETSGCGYHFSALGLKPGATLSVGYDDTDLLRIMIAADSAMAARDMSSDDDLVLQAGTNSVTIRTQRVCSVTLHARGRYL